MAIHENGSAPFSSPSSSISEIKVPAPRGTASKSLKNPKSLRSAGSTHWEPLGPSIKLLVSKEHRFNTDTILLAHFSMPKKGELCADLGTGCGTIPLLWCSRSRPKRVWGIELQPQAVALAKESVQFNKLDILIEIIQKDIKNTEELRAVWQPGSLDKIACNPPYTPAGKGEKNLENQRLLARHQAACSFSDIARTAAYFLRWGGKFFCCQRPGHLTAVFSALQREGLEPKRLRFVQQRPEKAPFLFLLEAARGGNVGMQVLPALFVEDPCSPRSCKTADTDKISPPNFSKEMLEIYGSYKTNDLKPNDDKENLV